MTHIEAEYFKTQYENKAGAYIEWVKITQKQAGIYSLLVQPVDGEQQSLTELEDAERFLLEAFARAERDARYFIMDDQQNIRESDREAWLANAPERSKTREVIECDSGVMAITEFGGYTRGLAIEIGLCIWDLVFETSEGVRFGLCRFTTPEARKRFIESYIDADCPQGFRFIEFRDSYAESAPNSLKPDFYTA
jgi:hypothetical protein